MNFGYNGVEVVNMDRRALIKSLVDKLTDEQAMALYVIIDNLAFPTVDPELDELEAIMEAEQEITDSKNLESADDVWRKLEI